MAGLVPAIHALLAGI